MSEILFINACVREHSRTRELADCVLKKLEGTVTEVDLYKTDLHPLNLEGMKIRDEASRTKDFSDARFDLAKQFSSAKTIVIAAPYWDLMFPAVLKLYFESVTVNGLTFAYGENGIPYSLCNADRLIYVTTAGGPIVKNFGYDYTEALARAFFGIRDVRCFSAEGLDIYGAKVEEILQKAKDSVSELEM